MIRFVGLSTMPAQVRAQAAADIIHLLEEPHLKHRIAARFPLDKIVEAHELQDRPRRRQGADRCGRSRLTST